MYGTIAKMKMKPGAFEALRESEMRRPAGFVASYVFQMDEEPDVMFMVAIFENRAAYEANANSPQQNADYLRIRALLQEDPQWHDGEVVFSNLP
jgi:quinol monooxygenase YgiN